MSMPQQLGSSMCFAALALILHACAATPSDEGSTPSEPVAASPADPAGTAPEQADPAEPSNQSQDQDQARRAPPHPGEGTRAAGESCTPTERCAQGLACSGLYYEKSGTCIPEAEAETQCKAEGGDWGQWGMAGHRYCMRVHADGGKACSDGSECAGDCIVQDDGSGQCQPHEVHFGCFARMQAGKPGGTLCVD